MHIHDTILKCYRYKLSTDDASSRLNMISLLLSTWSRKPAICSSFVERIYITITMSKHYVSTLINIYAEGNNQTEITSETTTVCVTFSKEDAYCFPSCLVLIARKLARAWEYLLDSGKGSSSSILDARSCFLNLQYLTYDSLSIRYNEFRRLKSLC